MRDYNKLFIFLIIPLFSNSTGLFATQEIKDSDTLSIQQVTIIKSYNPSLSDVFKLRDAPIISDSLITKKKRLEYSIFSVPVVSTFKPSKGEPKILKPIKSIPEFNSFLSAGFGNFNNLLIDYTSGIKIDRNQSIEWIISIDGIFKDIPNQEIESDTNSSIFNVSHTFLNNSMSLVSQINYHQNKINFYGVRSNALDPLILKSIDPVQRINYLSLGSRWKWFNSFFKKLNLETFLTSDSYESNEFEFKLNSKFQFSFLGLIVSGITDLNYFSNEFISDYYSETPLTTSTGKATFGLNFSYIRSKIKLVLGGKGVYGLSDGFNEEDIFVFPYLDVIYNSSDKLFVPFIKIEGDLKLNNFRTLTHYNPYVAPTIKLVPSNIPYEFRFGTKSSISKDWELTMNGFYQKNKNFPLYRNFGFDFSNYKFISYRYGNSFEVIYNEINTIGFETSVNAKFKNNGSIGLKASYMNYNTKELNKAWNLPKVKLEFNGNLNFKRSYNVQWNLKYLGKRYNAFRDEFLLQDLFKASVLEEKINSFFYSDIKITFKVNERWNIFIKGENFINKNNFEWSNYQLHGPLFLSGLLYNFDFNY
ncbi:MAG: hypothetical protein P8M03_02095 [Flavobacteriaceae bacterium]|nr:hypothetical protein [Flavobacteriaceae bacterium]